jgi:prepilin-type processing-associated H-X9-DG protein
MNAGRRSQSFSLIEVLVLVVLIAMLTVVLLPQLQASKAKTQRLQCAAQLREIGLALRQAQAKGIRILPESWPSQLSPFVHEDYRVYDCPSAAAHPSYGMNSRVGQMLGGDGYKIVMLDYRKLVADVVGRKSIEDWHSAVAARHNGACNVLRYDGSVDLRLLVEIAPTDPEIHDDWWRPMRAVGPAFESPHRPSSASSPPSSEVIPKRKTFESRR